MLHCKIADMVKITLGEDDSLLDILYLIRSERIRRRISQKELAEKVGRKRQWLHQVENGLIEPSFYSMMRLMKELSITIEFTPSEELEMKCNDEL